MLYQTPRPVVLDMAHKHRNGWGGAVVSSLVLLFCNSKQLHFLPFFFFVLRCRRESSTRTPEYARDLLHGAGSSFPDTLFQSHI